MSFPLLKKRIRNELLRKSSLALLALGLGVVCFHLANSITVWRAAQAEIRVAPFVLDVRSYTFEENPDGVLLSVRREARRSDGTKALSTTALGRVGLQAGETARKITYLDGGTVTLVDSIAVKTTWPRRTTLETAQMKAALLNPPTNCVYAGETLLGYGTVLGQHVAIVKQRPVSALDDEETISWRAPTLGCQEVQYRVEAKEQDDSLKLLARGEPVALKLGDPDPSLFDEGTNYAEVKPSERLRRQVSRLGIAWDSDMEAWGEEMDKIYSRTSIPAAP